MLVRLSLVERAYGHAKPFCSVDYTIYRMKFGIRDEIWSLLKMT